MFFRFPQKLVVKVGTQRKGLRETLASECDWIDGNPVAWFVDARNLRCRAARYLVSLECPSSERIVWLSLISSDTFVHTAQIFTEVERTQLRCATLEEVIALVGQFPAIADHSKAIIALGSALTLPEESSLVPYFRRVGTQRICGFTRLDSWWDGEYLFACASR